jgi:hypothetical protein
MDESRPTGIPENAVMPAPAAPAGSAPAVIGRELRRADPFAVALAVGGAMVIVGSLMSWNRFVVGTLVFQGKSGLHAPGTLLLGALMVIRGVSLVRGSNAGGFGRRGPALFIGPGLVLVLLVQYALTTRSHLIQWVLGPESAVIARLANLPSGEVLSRLRTTIDSGDVHLTLALGFWLAVAGAVVGLVAAAGMAFQRKASDTPAPH